MDLDSILTMKLENDSFDNEVNKDEIIMFGGYDDNPTEVEYFDRLLDSLRPHFEIIKRWALSQDRMPCGDEVNDYKFSFSDGENICFSMRAWGDFAQSIVGKKEGYMKYYMRWGAPDSRLKFKDEVGKEYGIFKFGKQEFTGSFGGVG